MFSLKCVILGKPDKSGTTQNLILDAHLGNLVQNVAILPKHRDIAHQFQRP